VKNAKKLHQLRITATAIKAMRKAVITKRANEQRDSMFAPLVIMTAEMAYAFARSHLASRQRDSDVWMNRHVFHPVQRMEARSAR